MHIKYQMILKLWTVEKCSGFTEAPGAENTISVSSMCVEPCHTQLAVLIRVLCRGLIPSTLPRA